MKDGQQADTSAGHQRLVSVPPDWSLQLCALYGCSTVYAARTVVPLVVQHMARDMGWDNVLVGYVLSFFFWGYAVTQVVGGRWADKVGGARVIVVTTLLGAGSLMLLPQLVGLWGPSAVLLRLFLGVVQGPHYPSMCSLAYQMVEEQHRARFLSIAFLGSPFGAVLVGMFGSIMLGEIGWRNTVIVIGCAYGFGALWLHRLTGQRKHLRAREPAAVESVPWCALLSSRAVWMCIIVHTSHTICWFLVISWMPSFFSQVHPTARGWVVNTLPFVSGAAGTVASTPLAEALLHRCQLSVTTTRKIVELISQLTVAAALFLLPLTDSAWKATLLVCACGAAITLHVNGGLQLPHDLCPHHSGSLFGIMNTGGALGGFFANLAAGYLLSDTGGDYAPVFQIAALVAVAGTLIFTAVGSAEPLRL